MLTKKPLDCRPVSFFGAYYLRDPAVCDRLISLFQAHPEYHTPGHVNTLDGQSTINDEVKESVELLFPPNATVAEFRQYTAELQLCVNEYIAEYPYSDTYAPWTIREWVNLQYYPPGGGYKVWHTERNNGTPVVACRHLVFMTYLNDVTDGGETEFYHQQLKVRPERGLTLIWPTDWTFTHRGIPSPTQEKYIITGWFGFESPTHAGTA